MLPKRNNENDTSLPRRGSRTDASTDKDREIQSLKDKLAEYEHHRQPKNVEAPQAGGSPTFSKQKTNQEIIDYISATMKNLELFKNQLSN